MNKAVTVLHCDRFCIIIANCPSPHTTHFKIRTILRKALPPLPPLSKGGGLTASYKLSLYCICLQYIRLFMLQTFLPSRRRDCSPFALSFDKHHHPYLLMNALFVSHYPSTRTNPSKSALSLEKHYHPCLPCQREVD